MTLSELQELVMDRDGSLGLPDLKTLLHFFLFFSKKCIHYYFGLGWVSAAARAFLWLQRAGPPSSRRAQASHRSGLLLLSRNMGSGACSSSSCGFRAQAQ